MNCFFKENLCRDDNKKIFLSEFFSFHSSLKIKSGLANKDNAFCAVLCTAFECFVIIGFIHKWAEYNDICNVCQRFIFV